MTEYVTIVLDDGQEEKKAIYDDEFMNWALLDLVEPENLQKVLESVEQDIKTDLKGYKGTKKAFDSVRTDKSQFILNNLDLIKTQCKIKDFEVSFDDKNQMLDDLGLELHIAIKSPIFNSFDFWKVNRENKRQVLKRTLGQVQRNIKTIKRVKSEDKDKYNAFRI